MANICSFSMKVKGSKEAVERVLSCFDKGSFIGVYETTSHPIKKRQDGLYEAKFGGSCAWDVATSMMRDGYYSDKKSFKDKATCIEEQSRDCEIEVFGEESGNNLGEHYAFRNGNCIIFDIGGLKEYVSEDGDPWPRHPLYIPDKDDYIWNMD